MRHRTSKYLNKQFGKWTCTFVGIARVQPKYKKNKELSKQHGRQSYYYMFERRTSDNKAEKMIILSAKEAADVWYGRISVEELAEKRKFKATNKPTKKISYSFF